MKGTTLLCILDGWGIGKNDKNSNAIFAANTPNYDRFLQQYPWSKISTSGLDVGLPDGQIGNSEVGHITIGSGRVIYQDLPRINKAISEQELEKAPELLNLIKKCHDNNNICHLLGLLSDGGVHSHQDHITYLAKILAKNGIEVKIHAFLDGRDVAQKSAINSLQKFQNAVKEFNNIDIVTISGRYYAMDRDNNWDRIKLAYDAISLGKGNKASYLNKAIEQSYQENITDEFVIPTSLQNFDGIKDGDALLVANFRADRIRQISQTLVNPNFAEFKHQKIQFCAQLAMTQYSQELNKYYDILFKAIEVKNSLPEILAQNNLSQLRIAETEKYAHVTFFFSGGKEEEYQNEDRILVKSPNVATYDLKPEMAALEVGKELKDAIKSRKYDFIVVNFANPDMVGHSGVFKSAIQACQIIDAQLGELEKEILAFDGNMLISADHGNIENMITEDGKPHTAHTTNPVPLILIKNDIKNIKINDGSLADIAPTILNLMHIKKPDEMTGKNLVQDK